jgi:hypothetical protein
VKELVDMKAFDAATCALHRAMKMGVQVCIYKSYILHTVLYPTDYYRYCIRLAESLHDQLLFQSVYRSY